MIANLLNGLVGLGLAYSAIFATPPGNMNNTWLAISSVAIIVLAAWARQTDPAGWQSATNFVLGVVLLLEAAARWVVEVAPLVSFWSILLIAIAIAIMALWSVLYQPDAARSPASS
jgi:hypothetical protein